MQPNYQCLWIYFIMVLVVSNFRKMQNVIRGQSALRFLVVVILLCDKGSQGSPMLPSDVLHQDLPPQIPPAMEDNSWRSDDGWWDDAEEIDLTIPLPPSLMEPEEEDNFLEEFLFLNDSSFLDDMDCGDFLQGVLPSPPLMEDIPPPPLPPFLVGMGDILQESFRRWHQRNNVEPFVLPKEEEDTFLQTKLEWVSIEDNQCSICHWANGGNETIEMLTRKQDPNVRLSNTMLVILVGVALISAAIGATVMGILLKCKKVKSLPCGSGRSWFGGSSSRRGVHTQGQNIPPTRNKVERPANGILPEFAMKLWRRGSSQAPLNPCSSPGSENSYVEEPYINADASSSTYAELNGAMGSVVTLEPSPMSHPCNNTYSEIPSPIHSGSVSLCSKICGGVHEGTYENSGYLLSETPSDQNESSTGSNSTPSSAYYSDVSSSDVYTNKKKKKKRKGDDRPIIQAYPVIGSNLSTMSSHSSVPVICSHVAHQPVHLNLNSVQSKYIPSRENVPVTLQLLPRQVSLESRNPALDSGTSFTHQQGMLHNKNLAHNYNVHPQNPRLFLNIMNHNPELSHVSLISPHHPNHQICVPQQQISSPRFVESNMNSSCVVQNNHDQLGNSLDNQYNGNLVQRPLPPLPSRQMTDPRRRNLKAPLGTIPQQQDIPSEV